MVIKAFLNIILMTLLTTEAADGQGQCGVKVASEPKEPILPPSAQLLRRQDNINLSNAHQQSIKVKVQTYVIRGGGKKVDSFTKESSKLWQNKLNEAFAPFQFSFEFLETTFYNMNVLEDPMNLIHRKNPELLHIVVAEKIFLPKYTPDLFGFATFPWDAVNDSFIDCVRVPAYSMPQHDPASLAHEVGHWLGLHHTFAFGCPEVTEENLDKSHHGDFVRDTLLGHSLSGLFPEHQCNALPIPDSRK
jgi:hypothetical protein